MSLAPDERGELAARRAQDGPQRGVVRLPRLPGGDRRTVDGVAHQCRVYPGGNDDAAQQLGGEARSIRAAIGRDRPGRQRRVAVPGGESGAVGARHHAEAGQRGVIARGVGVPEIRRERLARGGDHLAHADLVRRADDARGIAIGAQVQQIPRGVRRHAERDRLGARREVRPRGEPGHQHRRLDYSRHAAVPRAA